MNFIDFVECRLKLFVNFIYFFCALLIRRWSGDLFQRGAEAASLSRCRQAAWAGPQCRSATHPWQEDPMVWQTDLTDWLTDWLIDRPTNWLTDWHVRADKMRACSRCLTPLGVTTMLTVWVLSALCWLLRPNGKTTRYKISEWRDKSELIWLWIAKIFPVFIVRCASRCFVFLKTRPRIRRSTMWPSMTCSKKRSIATGMGRGIRKCDGRIR